MTIKFVSSAASSFSYTDMAGLKTFCQNISQALAGPSSIGLLRVPNANPGNGDPWDPNQIPVSGGYSNWSAINFNYSGGANQHYEVFKLPGRFVDNDIPLYLKLAYGTFYMTTAGLGVFVVINATVGTGVGTGTMTGPGSNLTYQIFYNYNANQGVNMPVSHFFSCDNFGLAMAIGIPSDLNYNYSNVFVIDRHRSVTDGKPLKTGASIYNIANTYTNGSIISNTQLDFVTVSGNATQDAIGHAPCVTAGNLSASSEQNSGSGQVQFHPWWGVTDNSRGPSRMITTANQANFAPPTQIAPEASVNFLGLQSIYKPLTPVLGNVSVTREAGACPAIYWDTNDIATPYDDTP